MPPLIVWPITLSEYQPPARRDGILRPAVLKVMAWSP